MLAITSSVFAQTTKFRSTTVDTMGVSVNIGRTSLRAMNVAYTGTVTVFVKMYDSKTKPYAKNAIPLYTIQIPPYTQATPYQLKDLGKVDFINGCWIRCTTSILDTSQKSAEPSIKPVIEIGF